MALNVAPRARDVTIQFKDSCNWCCWCCRSVTDETQVYINTKGHAVVFDPKKAEDERTALRRTISNLNRKIEQVASQSHRHTEEVRKELQEKLGKVLDEETATPITLGLLGRINAVLWDVL
jgi:predicted P-loop ATPase/GTPase